MHKILITITALTMMSTVASAQHRGAGHWNNRPSGHYSGYRSYNPAPYIAGAAVLGILGAITYDQYYRRCWQQIVSYNEYGEPIFQLVCQ